MKNFWIAFAVLVSFSPALNAQVPGGAENEWREPNTTIWQTALLLAEQKADYHAAADTLLFLRKQNGGADFLNARHEKLLSIIQSAVDSADNNIQLYKNARCFKAFSELFLHEFEFSTQLGTGNYYKLINDRRRLYYFFKYRTLIQYILVKRPAVTKPDAAAVTEKELLTEILYDAEADDSWAFAYNEIYNYLTMQFPDDDELREIRRNYAAAVDYEYRRAGSPEQAKDKIRERKISKRLGIYFNYEFDSIPEVSQKLCKGFNDYEKAYILYRWIGENIKYINDSTSELGVYAVKKPSLYTGNDVRETQSAERVFQQRYGVCEGFADLYTALCRHADIHAETVSGYTVSYKYAYGAHAWNILKIQGQWYLTDVTWGNDKYFFSNPVDFNRHHWASRKSRQLLFAPYGQKDFFENAEAFAEKLFELKPENGKLYQKLVSLYRRQNDYENSLQAADNYAETHGKNFNYYYNKAAIFMSQYEDSLAAAYFDSVLMIKPEHAGIMKLKINVYMRQIQYEKAEQCVDKMMRIKPRDPSVARKRAYVYMYQKKFDASRQIIDSLLALYPDDYEASALLSQMYYYKNDYARAKQMAERILEADNLNSSALFWLYNIHLETENYEQSDFYLKEIGKTVKETSLWYKKQIAFNFLERGDYLTAYNMLREIVVEQPLNKYTHDNLAYSAYYLHRYKESITYARRSIAICYENHAWDVIARSYIMLDEYEKAEAIFRTFKNKAFWPDPKFDTYNDLFLNDIHDSEKAGITHPDFEKAKAFFAEKKEF